MTQSMFECGVSGVENGLSGDSIYLPSLHAWTHVIEGSLQCRSVRVKETEEVDRWPLFILLQKIDSS